MHGVVVGWWWRLEMPTGRRLDTHPRPLIHPSSYVLPCLACERPTCANVTRVRTCVVPISLPYTRPPGLRDAGNIFREGTSRARSSFSARRMRGRLHCKSRSRRRGSRESDGMPDDSGSAQTLIGPLVRAS